MRAWFTALLIILAACSFAVAGGRGADETNALSYIPGDADCSGEVEALDVLTVLSLVGEAGDGMCAGWAGDVDCDGAVDGVDAAQILGHLAGLAQPSGGCPAIGTSAETPPTSYELIDAAVAASEITPGEGLLYKLYVDFGDERLPAEFAGADNGGHPESVLFQEIATAWDGLSLAEKEAIEPFLLPPPHPESWVEAGDIGAAAIVWETISSDRVKVWWQTRRPEDEAKAQAVLNAIEGKIWPDLVTYMGEDHAPLSDGGYPNSGGDGKFDIYLVHLPPGPPEVPDGPPTAPVLGYVSPHADAQGNYKCESTPAFMNMNSAEPLTPQFLSTVAHEFMHAIQFTYDVGSCDDYRWMFEATATWAENYVYPRVDSEHPFGYAFLEELEAPLERWIYKNNHQYGAYLFWFFLENEYGMQDAVADTWQASGNADSLKAIESVIDGQGGFDDVWPEFALYNWNREPYEEYTEWDKLMTGAKWKDETIEIQNAARTYSIPTDLTHMTQDHYHFTVMDSVKSIIVRNPFAGTGEEEHARVQALILRGGQWTRPAEDWTADPEKFFCMENPDQEIDELVVIISNSDHESRSHKFDVGPIEITASPVGCVGWTGSAQAEVYYYDARFKVTVSNVLFAPPEEEPGADERWVGYDLVRADVRWEASGIWPSDCPVSGEMTLAAPQSGEDHEASGVFALDREEGFYNVTAGGHNFDSKLVVQCPGEGASEQFWPVIPWIWDGGNVERQVEIEGGVARAVGSFVDPSEVYGGTWEWNFTEVK